MAGKKQTRIPKGFEVLAGLCQGFFGARNRVSERLEAIRRRRHKYSHRLIPGLRLRVADVDAAKGLIRDYLDEHKDQFARPRTRTLHGCKVGWRKMPGQLVVADEARTIQLIRSRLPEQAATLIRVRTTLDKAQLKKLPAADLAAVGAAIAAVEDEPVIAVPKDTLDQLVDALLADFEEKSS